MNKMIISMAQFLMLNIIFLLSNCQLKIPIKYYPIYNYNYNSPPLIMRNILQQKLYANIEIGTPKRTIQIPLVFDSNDFYIVDNNSVIKDPERFSNLKFYNSSDSSSFYCIEEDLRKGHYFEIATYNKDIFYFNNTKYELEFYFPFDSLFESGGIGMSIFPPDYLNDATQDVKRTFFGRLRQKGLVKTYHWTIFFDSKENKNEEEGFLLIGCLPHEVDSELGYYKKGYFSKENMRNINLKWGISVRNIFQFNYIYAYKGKDKKTLINDFPSGNLDYLNIELDYNFGGVRAPSKLKIFFHRVFEEYLSQGDCFSEYLYKQNNNFYYCKNNKKIITKIKNEFPGIAFISKDLNYTFNLDADDLFIEERGYVFCLLYFNNINSEKIWYMGKPFLKKYPFTINYDSKIISFYSNNNNNNTNI